MKKYAVINILLLLSLTALNAQPPYSVISTNTEKQIIPEGITVNPVDGRIYVTSIGMRKIIAIDQDGKHGDFISTGEHGFLEGLGVKIDAKKHWLWVVSNQKKGEQYLSMIQAFDLKTRAVKETYKIEDSRPHLFNDLVLHPNGKVYITDTFGDAVHEFDPQKNKLDLFVRDTLVARANGITCNAAGKIFIASRNGLTQLEVRSKKLSPLTFTNGNKALWMDGLVYWKNSIIGVADNVIMQYDLNSTGDQLIGEKIIDKKNEHFHDPTTAALYDNRLFVISNSYLTPYNNNKESVAGIDEQLGSVVILVYQLAAKK